jgi:hypothetical protein
MAAKVDLSTGMNWDSFKYMVFDAPNYNGTYEERYRVLGKIILNFCFISLNFILFFFSCFNYRKAYGGK